MWSSGERLLLEHTIDMYILYMLFPGLSNPEGLAIDWLSGNMYFSSYDLDMNKASISVARLSGTFRMELITETSTTTPLTRPQSIALHPHKG